MKLLGHKEQHSEFLLTLTGTEHENHWVLCTCQDDKQIHSKY